MGGLLPPTGVCQLTLLPPLSLIAPLLLLAASALFWLRRGPRPGALPRVAELAALASFMLAAAGLVQFVAAGPAVVRLGGESGLALFRLDLVSASMALLVSFIGWVVVR